ncbi:hypothetical protein WDW86_14475 [Bdellovibrionota bacterium FG-2]
MRVDLLQSLVTYFQKATARSLEYFSPSWKLERSGSPRLERLQRQMCRYCHGHLIRYYIPSAELLRALLLSIVQMSMAVPVEMLPPALIVNVVPATVPPARQRAR